MGLIFIFLFIVIKPLGVPISICNCSIHQPIKSYIE